MTISTKIIADSINSSNQRITTFELEYPRFIHSELMTHRAFSRNAASSRAIPIKKMLKLVRNNMAMPIHWGAKQSGMQARFTLSPFKTKLCKTLWRTSGYFMTGVVQLMNSIGLHKQVANRLVEPWSHIKVVLTATDFDNWFDLRMHKDAQPEIYELAKSMYKDLQNSSPEHKKKGEWHLPYVTEHDKEIHNLEKQLAISTSCCAQVSYRSLDKSIDKVERIFDLLVKSDVLHASPFEHCARVTTSGGSGNFSDTNWKQYRFYIERDLPVPK